MRCTEHRYVEGIEQKWCSKGRHWLTLDAFHKVSSSWDGLHYYCRPCYSIAVGYKSRGSRHYPHQVVNGLELKRCTECKRWLPLDCFYRSQSHCKDCHARCSREWQQANPERVAANNREWQQANLEKVAATRARRRALRAEAEGRFTAQEFTALCGHYGNHCLNRKYHLEHPDEEEGLLVADHVVPLSRGGRGDVGNIQPLCVHCNACKHTQTIDYRT